MKPATRGEIVPRECSPLTKAARRAGKPDDKGAFRSLWRAVRTKLRIGAREITFHDMRAKAASDSDADVAAQELLHHEDVKVTKRVYRRKVPTSTPLPSAIGGRGKA